MGNVSSSEIISNDNTDEDKKLLERVNTIASKLILTQEFEEMIQMKEKKYCDGVMILTAEILEKYFSHQDINLLDKMIHKDQDEDEDEDEDEDKDEDKDEEEKKKEEGVYFVLKNNVNKLVGEGSEDKLDKKRKCLSLAKYYVKIAHIFAAVITTINPSYVIANNKTETGVETETGDETEEVSLKDLMERGETMETKKIVEVKQRRLCDEKVDILKQNEQYLKDIQNNAMEDKKIIPTNEKPIHCRSAYEEPTVQELSNLYNDVYDEETGTFNSMSKGMKDMYNKDLATFYKEFTGKNIDKKLIKNFSDIKLRSYNDSDYCEQPRKTPNEYSVNTNKINKDGVTLIEMYSKHLANTLDETTKKQNKLIEILDKIFILTDDKNNVKIITGLTSIKLEEIIKDVRQIIMELYIQCERSFKEGIEIFEMIVLNMNIETAKPREESLTDLVAKEFVEP